MSRCDKQRSDGNFWRILEDAGQNSSSPRATTPKHHEPIALLDPFDSVRNLQLGVGGWAGSFGRCFSVRPNRIVLNASGMMDPIAAHAQLGPSLDIVRFLHANQIEQLEDWSDQRSKLMKPSLGFWRQTRINKGDRNFPAMRFSGEIRQISARSYVLVGR